MITMMGGNTEQCNKEKVQKEHRLKYQQYWDKSHAAKLSNIRKYDLSRFRFKDVNKHP